MPRHSLTPHRRHILVLRHRARAWQTARDTLFDADGLGLFYQLCLAKEGYGTRAEAFSSFESTCRVLLDAMCEARPEAGAEISTQWESWFASHGRR